MNLAHDRCVAAIMQARCENIVSHFPVRAEALNYDSGCQKGWSSTDKGARNVYLNTELARREQNRTDSK